VGIDQRVEQPGQEALVFKPAITAVERVAEVPIAGVEQPKHEDAGGPLMRRPRLQARASQRSTATMSSSDNQNPGDLAKLDGALHSFAACG
jgi:hypothetical protein